MPLGGTLHGLSPLLNPLAENLLEVSSLEASLSEASLLEASLLEANFLEANFLEASLPLSVWSARLDESNQEH